jgi:hypothetical protein
MASEVLSIPEEHLGEVIKVIRAGLAHAEVSEAAEDALVDWCDDTERYLREMAEEGEA